MQGVLLPAVIQVLATGWVKIFLLNEHRLNGDHHNNSKLIEESFMSP